MKPEPCLARTAPAKTAGGRYDPPVGGENVLGAASSSLRLILAGGDLGGSVTNEFILNANNQVQNSSLPYRLGLNFMAASGLFAGWQSIPAAARPVAFQGVVVQGQTNGAGYFLGTDQSGRVWLQSE